MKTIKYQAPNHNSVFGALKIREHPQDAFENAFLLGMQRPEEWMYMYSDRGCDFFKHVLTREYCKYPQAGLKWFMKRMKCMLPRLIPARPSVEQAQ